MLQSYFIFKGQSSLDKNIIVSKLPPIERAQANIEKITVQGRDGFLTNDLGTYQSTIKPCECSLDNGNIDDVCAWLTGSGEVIFSNEPNKKYKATIINQIPFGQIIPTFHTFILQFDCQPHKYAVDNNVITLIASGTKIYNKGAASEPVIKVFGTGNIDLTINNNVVHLTNVVDYVTVDSDLMDCYKDTVLKNSNMLGDFPMLTNGQNTISWTGTVIKVEITPNWRWL